MTVAEIIYPFTIHPSYDGDMAGGVDFTVFKEEEQKQESPVISEPLKIEQPVTIIHPVSEVDEKQSMNTIYRVQVYALPGEIRDVKILRKIERFVPGLRIVEVKGEDGFYRYMSEPVLEMEKAQRMVYYLRRIGYLDSFIRKEK